jgi:hypothetical protein
VAGGQLDLGNSMIFKQKVTSAIKEKLPATIELTIFGMLITLLVGVPLGAYAADNRRSTRDYLIRLYGIVIYCIPVYWLGLMFQMIFGVWLDWFPVAGRTGPRVFASTFEQTGLYIIDTLLINDWKALWDVLMHLVLPSLTLGLVLSGHFHSSDPGQYARRFEVRLYPGRRSTGHTPLSRGIQARTAERLCTHPHHDGPAGCPAHGRRRADRNHLFLARHGTACLLERIYLRDYPSHSGRYRHFRPDRGVYVPGRGYHLRPD